MQIQDYIIPVEAIQQGKELGGGAFGKVYVCYLNTINIEAAMKVIKPFENQEEQTLFMSELDNLSKLHHPGCLRLIGFYIPDSKRNPDQGPILVTPLLNGNMSSFIVQYQLIYQDYLDNKDDLDDDLRDEIKDANTTLAICLYGICRALHYIHNLKPKKIIHRDLKPDNILFDKFQYPVLADFGLSVQRIIKNSQHSAGTDLYKSPEAFEGTFTPKTDIYAVGLIFYRVWNEGDIFYYDGEPILNSQQLYQVRKTGVLPDEPEGIPKPIWDVICKCLEPSMDERPSAADLVEFFKHPSVYLGDLYDKEEFDEYIQTLDFEEGKTHKERSKRHYFQDLRKKSNINQ